MIRNPQFPTTINGIKLPRRLTEPGAALLSPPMPPAVASMRFRRSISRDMFHRSVFSPLLVIKQMLEGSVSSKIPIVNLVGKYVRQQVNANTVRAPTWSRDHVRYVTSGE